MKNINIIFFLKYSMIRSRKGLTKTLRVWWTLILTPHQQFINICLVNLFRSCSWKGGNFPSLYKSAPPPPPTPFFMKHICFFFGISHPSHTSCLILLFPPLLFLSFGSAKKVYVLKLIFVLFNFTRLILKAVSPKVFLEKIKYLAPEEGLYSSMNGE